MQEYRVLPPPPPPQPQSWSSRKNVVDPHHSVSTKHLGGGGVNFCLCGDGLSRYCIRLGQHGATPAKDAESEKDTRGQRRRAEEAGRGSAVAGNTVS